jgi:hypothetical protein
MLRLDEGSFFILFKVAVAVVVLNFPSNKLTKEFAYVVEGVALFEAKKLRKMLKCSFSERNKCIDIKIPIFEFLHKK